MSPGRAGPTPGAKEGQMDQEQTVSLSRKLDGANLAGKVAMLRQLHEQAYKDPGSLSLSPVLIRKAISALQDVGRIATDVQYALDGVARGELNSLGALQGTGPAFDVAVAKAAVAVADLQTALNERGLK